MRSNSAASAARSSTSSPATLWRSTCPVGVVSPSTYTFRRRISSGLSPTASASRFRWVSAANSVCGAPNPRNAPFGGVFVRVTRERIRTFGQRYGPPAWSAPRDSTTGDRVQYAPPSITTSMSCATSVPSRRIPVRCVTTAGWRFVVAEMSSWRS